MAMLSNKQQELEFILIETCNDRDKQSKFIEEFSKKYVLFENEQNELEKLVEYYFINSKNRNDHFLKLSLKFYF